jgi:hypothetical protein
MQLGVLNLDLVHAIHTAALLAGQQQHHDGLAVSVASQQLLVAVIDNSARSAAA